jgi:hypothetical protein
MFHFLKTFGVVSKLFSDGKWKNQLKSSQEAAGSQRIRQTVLLPANKSPIKSAWTALDSQ